MPCVGDVLDLLWSGAAWLGAALQFVGVCLAVATGAALLLFAAFLWAREWRILRLRRAAQAAGIRYFFIWRSRRGWNEFIRHNVLPALPPDIVAVRQGGSPWEHELPVPVRFPWEELVWALNPGYLARPYLVPLARKHPRIELHRELLPLKRRGKADPAVQRETRGRIEAAIERATGGQSANPA